MFKLLNSLANFDIFRENTKNSDKHLTLFVRIEGKSRLIFREIYLYL